MNRLLVALLISLSTGMAYYGSSDFRTFSQPDGKTEFSAKCWGDQYFWYWETDDGYRIIPETDSWWYYVVLDKSGEFISSGDKVGVDQPPPESYHLERSVSRLEELASIAEANDIQDNRWCYTNLLEGDSAVVNIGVFLVEFTDLPHYSFSQPNPNTDSSRVNGYLEHDYYDQFFSTNRYYDSSITGIHSPDGLEVFGSFYDYWFEQTKGELRVHGSLINDVDENGVIDWYCLDSTFAFYASPDTINGLQTGWLRILSLTHVDTFLDCNGGPFDKILIIHAGNFTSSSLNPQALYPYGGCYNIFGMHERSLRNGMDRMVGIGGAAHEFGHTIGLGHTGGDYIPFAYWDLMKLGDCNGPVNRLEQCPALLIPPIRIDHGWIDVLDTLDSDTTGMVLAYNYNDPQIYYLKTPASAVYFNTEIGDDDTTYGYNEYYLVNKLQEKFDEYTPIPPSGYVPPEGDPKNLAGGMLIWKKILNPIMIPADNSWVLGENWDHYYDTFEEYSGDFWPNYQGQNWDATTSPSTLVHLETGHAGHPGYWEGDADPHIAMHNICWNSGDSTVSLDLYFNAYTGDLNLTNINADLTLYGDITTSNDITIPSGVTVKILSGSTISLPAGKKITVQGNLIVDGSPTDTVKLKPEQSGSNNRWYGLYVTNSGSVTVRNAIFENATYGLRINGNSTSIDVENCSFINNAYGIYAVSHNNSSISNIEFWSNNAGIYMYNSDMSVHDNLFFENIYNIYGYYSDFHAWDNEIIESSHSGLLLSRSNPTIEHNDISSNYYGIYCTNYSAPDFSNTRESGDNTVNNHIYSNTYRGVYVGSYASPNFGVFGADGPPMVYEGGFNYFNDNNNYDIYNGTGSAVLAETNWWENNTPVVYGSVQTTPRADVTLGMGPGTLPKPTTSDEQAQELLLHDGLFYERHGNIEEAVTCFDSIIVLDHTSRFAKLALMGLERCYHHMDDVDGLLLLLGNYVSTYNDEFGTVSKYFIGGNTARQGNLISAASTFDECAIEFSEYPESDDMIAWSLFDAGQISEIANDPSETLGKATQYFGEILNKYPKTEAASILRGLMGKNFPGDEKPALPTQFKLGELYPNPFNPMVTIPYDVPELSDINLFAYDLLGRVVWSKSTMAQQPGSYSVNWSGQTNAGKQVPSGIYFIRMEAGSYNAVRKITYLK